MAKNANLKNNVAQVVKTNGVKGITGANLQPTILQVIDKLGGGYQFGGLVQPNGTFPVDVNGNSLTDQNFAFLASTPGTYTNFGGLVVNEGEVCVFLWDGTWTKQVTGIATDVELSQLGQQVIYDVSANNDGATFASLSALLSSENLSTLIPVAVRCGGMSIRFVQTSDNNYMHYNLKANMFSVNVEDWESIYETEEKVQKISNHEISPEEINEEIEIKDNSNETILSVKENGLYVKKIFNLNGEDYIGDIEKDVEHIENTTESEYGEEAIEVVNDDNETVVMVDDKKILFNNCSYLDGTPIYKKPYNLNYGLNEMCVQWTTPFAIQTKLTFRSKLIWGWTDSNGKFGVGCYDERTKTIERKEIGDVAAVDMHNNPAVIELADGKIGVASCHGHNNYSKVWVYISSAAGSISNFETPVEIDGWFGRTSYSQLHYIDGVYYLFVRTYDYGNTNEWHWQVSTSEDFVNWSTPISVIKANTQYYCRFVKVKNNDSVLRIVMYANPDRTEVEIRLGYFDTETGNLYSGSYDSENIVGNINNTVPYFTDYEIIVSRPANGKQRLFDVAVTDINNVVISYARWTTQNDSIYYYYKNGTSIKICDGGDAYLYPRAQLGDRFLDDSNIVVARNQDGIDYVELYRIINNIPIMISRIDSVGNGNEHVRLNMPMFDEDGQYLFYAKGVFNPNDYEDFDCDFAFVKLV